MPSVIKKHPIPNRIFLFQSISKLFLENAIILSIDYDMGQMVF